MKLARFFDSIDLYRDDKIASLRFGVAHRVLSTCPANGGLADDLDAVFNHQVCEPSGHFIAPLMDVYTRPKTYNRLVMDLHGLDDAKGAGMDTAANMRHLAFAQHTYQDLGVVAIATAGVDGNAARAGDPASFYEMNGQYHQTESHQIGDIDPQAKGTINVIVAVNQPLTEGALVRAIIMTAEAKAALLQELSIPSRQSNAIATGTGTDQIAICAPATKAPPLSIAGHSAKLGELIALASKEAIAESLARQNQITPTRQCSLRYMLERFGLMESDCVQKVAHHLPPDLAARALTNGHMIERDPLIVASVMGLIHVFDQTQWGVLPQSGWPEICRIHGAMIAMAASGNHGQFSQYLARLRDADPLPATLIPMALALGFADKWTRFTDALTAKAQALKDME